MWKHKPVLVNSIIGNLPTTIKLFLDGTLGHGGHTQAILDYLSSYHKDQFNQIEIIGIDKDHKILQDAANYLNMFQTKIQFINSSYKEFTGKKCDLILLDLGVNLEHFKDANRGFSLKRNGQLDMRFDIRTQCTAADVINGYTPSQLASMFQKYTDFNEYLITKIVDNIIKYRKIKHIDSTDELKNILKSNLHFNDKKIAVIFQGIRIEVNQELDDLEIFLKNMDGMLNSRGRCMIISYHSIEDRIIKQKFKFYTNTNKYKLINKHVIKPSYQEIQTNPAARSAKLRIIEYL